MPREYEVAFIIVMYLFCIAGAVIFGINGWSVMLGAGIGILAGVGACYVIGDMVPDDEPDDESIARRNLINDLSREHGEPEPYPTANRRGATKNGL